MYMCLDASSNAQLQTSHSFVQPADSDPEFLKSSICQQRIQIVKRTIILHGVDHNLSKPGLADGLDSLVCCVI